MGALVICLIVTAEALSRPNQEHLFAKYRSSLSSLSDLSPN